MISVLDAKPHSAADRMDSRHLTFISSLYRAASSRHAPEFRSWALGALRQLLPFDAAVWTNASQTDRHIHLLSQWGWHADPTRLTRAVEDEYTQPVAEQLVPSNAPGVPRAVAIYDDNARERAAALHRRACVEGRAPVAALETFLEHPTIATRSVLTLCRGEGEEPFTSEEAEVAAGLLFYLVDASSLALFLHLRKPPLLDRNRKAALATARGLVLEAQPGFTGLVEAAHTNWHGGLLPFPLPDPDQTEPVDSGSLMCSTERLGELRVVRVWQRTVIDQLTARERQCVVGLCRGMQLKEIASELGVAPSTVSTNISRASSKLGVTSRRQLREVMEALPRESGLRTH